jgi:hypothetical protein
MRRNDLPDDRPICFEVEEHPESSNCGLLGLPLLMHRRLVCVALFPVRFGPVFRNYSIRFADCFRTGDEWRKTFEKLIEHFAAREQFLNSYADLDTIIAGLFKGTIVAVRGHLF